MNRSVIYKLLSFTFAMVTLPLGTYFFTVAYVFNGRYSPPLATPYSHPQTSIPNLPWEKVKEKVT
jgi:hypothetical protein